MATTTTNPDYTKFDLQKEKNLTDEQVHALHTCTIDKSSVNLLKLFPGHKDGLQGLNLGWDEITNKCIVTGMNPLAPWQNTTLKVGWTIFCINGVSDFTSVEQAAKIIS